MQALKMFTSGQGAAQASTGAGGAQNAFVGMAMGEAAKLFDSQSSQGNTVRTSWVDHILGHRLILVLQGGASKQDVVAQAGQMAMKMFLKSEMGGSGGGIMSLAGKFLQSKHQKK